MVELQVDATSQQRLEGYIGSLSPRVMAQVHRALQTFVYQGVQAGIQKYFAGSGPRGGPTTSLLTSRSGALANSLLESAEVGIDPPSPGANTTTITLRLGSPLPYAGIQEYGGVAGRPGPFKKSNGRRPYLPARPYLRPIFNDLEAMLPDLLRQAVNVALNSQ
jgi:phage gpG-like protein